METVQNSTQNKKKYRASESWPKSPWSWDAESSERWCQLSFLLCRGSSRGPQMCQMVMNGTDFYPAPAPPCHPRVSVSRRNAECFTLFLGLNFFRLELNQVGRKF